MGYYVDFKLEGFTEQSGSGDPSSNNIRPIKNVGQKTGDQIETTFGISGAEISVKLHDFLHKEDTFETNVNYNGEQKSVETHLRKTIIFTGTENITENTDPYWAESGYHVFQFSFNGISSSTNADCSHYKVKIPNNTLKGTEGVAFGTNNILFSVSSQSTVDEFKAYLLEQFNSGNQVTIEYDLSSPDVYIADPIEPTYIKNLTPYSISKESGAKLYMTYKNKFTSPKIDWENGDFFELDPDYNRIKSNIEVIKELSDALYLNVIVSHMPEEYSVEDNVYSDVPNNIVNSIEQIKSGSYTPDGYKYMRTYINGEPAWTANEINAIENNILLLYNIFIQQENALPKLQFKLGTGGIF